MVLGLVVEIVRGFRGVRGGRRYVDGSFSPKADIRDLLMTSEPVDSARCER